MILGNSLGETPKFSLGTMDETFCNMSVRIFCNRRFWMERKHDIALCHRFENILGLRVFGIDISAGSS